MAAPQKYAHIDFTPPAGARKQAEQGLKLRREHGRGGTAVGIARARDISNGVELSPSTVRRMKAFFDRHASDSKAEGFRQGEKGWPSNGVIANKLWGGPAGYAWAKKVVAQMEAVDARSTYSLDAETSTIEAGTDRRSSVIPNVERRFLGNFSETEEANPDLLRVEERADPETGKKQTYLVGYAARFGKNSLLLGDFVERIAPSAFDIVEKRKDADGKPLETRCLFNHSPDNLLGRFPTTMRMWVDEQGLRYECLLPETRKDIAELVARGDLKGSSFSFIVAEGGEKWSTEEGRSLRLVTRIKSLLDCGPVTYPAYDSATVAVAKRSYDQFVASNAPATVVEKRDSGIAARVAEEAKKTEQFLAERRAFCATGAGGGIDNSCSSKGDSSGKPADDVGVHVSTEPGAAKEIANAIGGATSAGLLAGVGGSVAGPVGAVVGATVGAVGTVANYIAMTSKAADKIYGAMKKLGTSESKLDKAARTLDVHMTVSPGQNGSVVAESSSGFKIEFQKYAKDEVGPKNAGLYAHVSNPGGAIGGKGTESVDRLANTLVKAARQAGASHITVNIDKGDPQTAYQFEDEGYSLIVSDGPNYVAHKDIGGKSKRSYEELQSFLAERRGFCPTGEGGGIDNSCGGGKGGGGDQGSGGSKSQKPNGLKDDSVDLVAKYGQSAGYKVEPKMGYDSGKPKGGYAEWKKGDHLDKAKEKDTQAFLDKARTDQLARGGKDQGKADDGGGVQTWSKGEHFPWTTKQVGTDEGYIQGQHPDGSKTAKYPFKGDPSEAHRKVIEEIKSKKKDKRSVTLAEMTAFLMERAG